MAKKETLFVKSRSPNGFRRAGIAFDRNGVDLDPATLTEAQLDAIINEPNLDVVGVVAETEAERKAREKAEAGANAAAVKREKAAIKATSQAAWDTAAARAAQAAELTPEEFAALADADRVARIEAVIAADADQGGAKN